MFPMKFTNLSGGDSDRDISAFLCLPGDLDLDLTSPTPCANRDFRAAGSGTISLGGTPGGNL